MNKTSMILLVCILCVVSFFIGHKVGDSQGYADGYNEGYRYDCKEEIASIYKQVKAQSKFLDYTDSSVRQVMHENDSLKRKEYYQKRFQDSLKWIERYSKDSVSLYKVSRKYADSLNKVTGGLIKNIVQDDGTMNLFGCLVEPYKKIPECQDGYNMQERLKKRLELQKSSKNKGKK